MGWPYSTWGLSTLKMRVTTLCTFGFFILCSLCVSTNALSPGFYLGKDAPKKEEEEVAAEDGEEPEGDKDEEADNDENKDEGAEGGDEAEKEGNDDGENKGEGEEGSEDATEANGADDGGDEGAEAGGAGNKERIEGLIGKLKDINTFLKEMVTYWDDHADKGGEAGASEDGEAA